MDHAQQRVHPVDPESSSSMNSAAQHPSKYVMLSDNQGSLRPPPYRRNIPRYHSAHHKSGGGCMKCIGCCYCFLFLFILLLSGIVFYMIYFVKPTVPTYTVQRLDISAFNVQMDFSLYTEFLVTVKAENPNHHIGFDYGKESSVDVMYSDSTLCSGKLPAFLQGHENTTMMKIVLRGKSAFGTGLQEALMKNRHTGRIPLLVQVKAPVRVVLGDYPLRHVDVFVNCSLVVDSLSPNKRAEILSSKYDVSVTF